MFGKTKVVLQQKNLGSRGLSEEAIHANTAFKFHLELCSELVEENERTATGRKIELPFQAQSEVCSRPKRNNSNYAFQTFPGATCTAAIPFRVSTMHWAQSASS
jgi:hypothetical protein